MGSCISYSSIHSSVCCYCKTYVDTSNTYIHCVRCKTKMHKKCYDTNKKSVSYTQCKNCNNIGCLGTVHPTDIDSAVMNTV